MNSNVKYLFEEVIKEAELLKSHATSEELERCIPSRLDPDRATQCIYGLMTGHCDSPRAVELLNLCANMYSSSFDCRSAPIRVAGFKPEVAELSSTFTSRENYSAIEFYIAIAEDEGESVAKFLNGQTNELKVSDLYIKEDFDDVDLEAVIRERAKGL